MVDRNKREWQEALDEDMRLVKRYLVDADEPELEGPVHLLAMARKEARRLESDIERYAKDTFGITKKQLDEVKT